MFTAIIERVHPFVSFHIYEQVTDKWVTFAINNLTTDCTLLAVLRALIHPRTANKFFLYQIDSHQSFANIMNRTDGFKMLQNIAEGYGVGIAENTFTVIRCRAINEKSFKQMTERLETIEDKPINESTGFKRLIAIEEYITKIFNVAGLAIYINEARNSVIILVSAAIYEMRMHHLLASFVPIMLPQLFKENKLTDNERTMLSTLTKTSSTAFLNAMEVLGKDLNLNESIYIDALLTFEKANRQQMLTNSAAELKRLREEAKVLVDRYRLAMDRVDEAIIRYEGLNNIVNQTAENSDLVEYIKAHKNIKLIDIDGTTIEMILSTYLEVFDVPGYEHLKKLGTIYKGYAIPGDFGTEADARLFMDALFNDDPQIKIKLCGYYKLNLNGSVTSRSRYNYAQYSEFDDYIPNPHLNIHNCLSRNEMYIAEQLRKSEIIGAIECCFSSAMSVDIHETPQTFRPMMDQVFASKKKIIHNVKTGTDMTPKEALEWLKANKE